MSNIVKNLLNPRNLKFDVKNDLYQTYIYSENINNLQL